ncbi:MAG TPA: phosphatidylglycerol lysyltransferase domain-containing protein [Methanocorpusculum sp.]|nr:phosphatidylglycerol lysyltransferase domain-containing protein [Methanocorpusculum sp.]
MTGFKPLTLADKPVFDKYCARYPQYHSEASFVTIYAWNDSHPCTYCDTGTHLVYTIGEAIFAPIGAPDTNLFESVLACARKQKLPLAFADTTYLDYMQRTHPDILLNENRSYAEYYYETKVLASLHGRAYQTIRKQINRFNARHIYTVEPISDTNMPEILAFLDTWGARNITTDNIFKRDELKAVKITLAHMNELACEGIALRIEGQIRALAVWELLPNKVALIHYEKADKDFEGIYKIINLETARALCGRCDWINRESDVDSPGLREAKLRYHPHHLCKIWYVTP